MAPFPLSSAVIVGYHRSPSNGRNKNIQVGHDQADLFGPEVPFVGGHGSRASRLGDNFHVAILKAVCFASLWLPVQSIYYNMMYKLYILRRCDGLNGQKVVRNLVLHVNKFVYNPNKFKLLKLLGWLGLSMWNVRRSKIKWIRIRLGLGECIFRSDTQTFCRKILPEKVLHQRNVAGSDAARFFSAGHWLFGNDSREE